MDILCNAKCAVCVRVGDRRDRQTDTDTDKEETHPSIELPFQKELDESYVDFLLHQKHKQ